MTMPSVFLSHGAPTLQLTDTPARSFLAGHLMPLYAAIGAAGLNMRTERLHASSTYGVLRMDVYAFCAEQAIAPEMSVSAHSA